MAKAIWSDFIAEQDNLSGPRITYNNYNNNKNNIKNDMDNKNNDHKNHK